MNAAKIPKLRTMRDSKPITGQVWVVDENNHMVASFNIKRPECHLARSTSEILDSSLNLAMAQKLIEHLNERWSEHLVGTALGTDCIGFGPETTT
jgi:hypothetical protein